MRLEEFLREGIRISREKARAARSARVVPFDFVSSIVDFLSEKFSIGRELADKLYKPLFWVLFDSPDNNSALYYQHNGNQGVSLGVRGWFIESEDAEETIYQEVTRKYKDTLIRRCGVNSIPLEA